VKPNSDPIIALPNSPRRAVVSLLLLLAILIVSPLQALHAAGEPQQPLVVFIVRHAEKAGGGGDPDLTAAGRLRAAELAVLLRDSGIKHVYSTDTKRARGTAPPVAAELGVEVEDPLYDRQSLPALVARARQAGGRHLIVGHSNTIPETVELLGGEPGSAIDEKSEFDRLYIVSIATNGEVSTVMMRYGAPYSGGSSK